MQNFLNPNEMNRADRVNAVRQSLIDFGFYHDLNDVKRMYAEYVNNKQYGYAGGVMDQRDGYWHDMSMMRDLAFYVEELLPFASDDDRKSLIQQLKDGDSIAW